MKAYTLESKEDMLLKKVSIILALLIVFIMSLIILLLSYNVEGTSFTKYSYNCKSFEEQIENTNKNSLLYFCKSINPNYESILISPLGLQSSVYEYFDTCGEQRPKVFSYFENGFKTWDESRRLFNCECFMTFVPDTIDSNEELIGRTTSATKGYLDSLGVDIEYNSSSLYSIFNLPLSIKNGKYCTEDKLVYYDGVLEYKKVSNYEAIKLPLSSNKYEIYFIDGKIDDFSFDGFREREGLVTIDSYIWQSYGAVNGIGNEMGYTNSDLVMLSQFGFSSENNEVVNEISSITDNKFYFVEDFYFIITDKETGIILALGKHK